MAMALARKQILALALETSLVNNVTNVNKATLGICVIFLYALVIQLAIPLYARATVHVMLLIRAIVSHHGMEHNVEHPLVELSQLQTVPYVLATVNALGSMHVTVLVVGKDPTAIHPFAQCVSMETVQDLSSVVAQPITKALTALYSAAMVLSITIPMFAIR